MLYDAINIFEKKLKKEAEQVYSEENDGTDTEMECRIKLLVDNYVPKDGTYLLIHMDEDFRCETPLEIKYDKKSGELQGITDSRYRYIRYLDYNSKLIEMNKPIDAKKVIHSNQTYAFFFLILSISEKKLTQDVVDGYYNTLSEPESKYTKTQARNLYQQAVKELGEPDRDAIDKISAWIKDWLVHPELLPIDYAGKDYLKLFFVYEDQKKTKELYEQENRRYVIPNIYNNNDYNVKVNGTILGMPSNNLGLNAKKPFLENKQRKTPAPYLLDMNQVILQSQFFDYLWGHACKSNVNVFIDLEEEEIYAVCDRSEELPMIRNGLYLRIRKGKEVEILDCDIVMDVSPNLTKTLYFKPIVKGLANSKNYSEYNTTARLAAVIDEVFFDKYLSFNYFTDAMELPQMDGGLKYILLTYRGRIFSWLYKTPQCDLGGVVAEMALKLIKNKIAAGYFGRACEQLNLLLSLEDYFNENHDMEERMGTVQQEFMRHIDMLKEEWTFTDSEYYYAVGQLVSYFLSLSKSAKKPLSMANQFLNAGDDSLIKEKLSQMFIRYDHAIDSSKDSRAKNVISHIMMYEPESKKVLQRELIAGLTAASAFYMKKDE